MRPFDYIRASLRFYRSPHLAAAAGSAIATAVLTGALLLGFSVRESLRDLALSRLGNVATAVTARSYFRDSLAANFAPDKSAPIIDTRAAAIAEKSKLRAFDVELYGIAPDFLALQNSNASLPGGRSAWVSPGLAAELHLAPGDAILLRTEEPSDIPREFLHGRRESTSRTLRYVVAAPPPGALTRFSLARQQGDVLAVYVPLARLQKDLAVGDRANTIVIGEGTNPQQVAQRLRDRADLEDLGFHLRPVESGDSFSFEHASTLLDDQTALDAIETGRKLQLLTRPYSVYVANAMTSRGHVLPYSLVAAADPATLTEVNGDRPLAKTKLPPIVLNQWAAADLAATVGAPLDMDYFFWTPSGRLETRTAQFQVAGIAPMSGPALDRNIAPPYPGITDKASLSNWDPPFPIDLKLIRPRDEEYWRLFRTTPKAWIPLDTARQLWGSRFGSYTSIRFASTETESMDLYAADLRKSLRASIDPLAAQFTVLPLRDSALAAAQGTTDFGEYFLYFSFFLSASALILIVLFVRLGLDQRAHDVFLLRAAGLAARRIRSLFLWEEQIVALAGSAAGVLLGLLYAGILILGLRYWWTSAVGTRLLSLHVSPALLALGLMAGLALSAATVWWALRQWAALPVMGLRHRRAPLLASHGAAWIAATCFALCILLLLAAAADSIPDAAAYFGAGLLLLTGLTLAAGRWLVKPLPPLPAHDGSRALASLALRNTAWRPGRSLAILGLFGSAAFLLVSLEAFRHAGESGPSGLYAESQAPLMTRHTGWYNFRLQPGDDLSCLNLYRPAAPRVLGVPDTFLDSTRIPVTLYSGAAPETRQKPWTILNAQLTGNIIPAFIDENSLTYSLHKKIGDELTIPREGASPIRFRIVGTLRGTLFQSELLISEKKFQWLYPQINGWRVFLIDTPVSEAAALESEYEDYGFDAMPAAARLASYRRVEDTYLSTFQALGALGLLLGAGGLAAVLLRNVLDRRRELALLRACGFPAASIERLIFYEHAGLLAAGLAAGFLAALVAVLPALDRPLPVLRITAVLLLVFAAGVFATRLGVRAALRGGLLTALRSE